MTNGFDVRLIDDPPLEGAWNMGVDEALMRSVGADNEPNPNLAVLRFYQWKVPTLSLGYFQRHQERNAHLPSSELPMVRRNSGGGAIVHDIELTYSLTVTETGVATHFDKSSQLYLLMHQSLIDCLSSFGVESSLVTELEKDLERNFLCFNRRAPNDVLVDGKKVCGSAQRKKFQSISQHGSVILGTSRQAPEITGINDISGANLTADMLKERWLAGLMARLGCEPNPSTLTKEEKKWAKESVEGKFAAVSWSFKR